MRKNHSSILDAVNHPRLDFTLVPSPSPTATVMAAERPTSEHAPLDAPNPFDTRPSTPSSAQALYSDVDHAALPPGAGAPTIRPVSNYQEKQEVHDNQEPLLPPSAPFIPYADSPTPSESNRNSAYYPPTPTESRAFLDSNDYASPSGTPRASTFLAAGAPLAMDNEKVSPPPGRTRKPLLRRPLFWILAALLLAVVVVAVVVPVVLTVGKHKSGSSGASSGSSSGGGGTSGGGGKSSGDITGGDGSTVTTTDGSTFTYKNPFGGFWYQDLSHPFAYNAQPNSWTKPLNESWDFTTDKMNG